MFCPGKHLFAALELLGSILVLPLAINSKQTFGTLNKGTSHICQNPFPYDAPTHPSIPKATIQASNRPQQATPNFNLPDGQIRQPVDKLIGKGRLPGGKGESSMAGRRDKAGVANALGPWATAPRRPLPQSQYPCPTGSGPSGAGICRIEGAAGPKGEPMAAAAAVYANNPIFKGINAAVAIRRGEGLIQILGS